MAIDKKTTDVQILSAEIKQLKNTIALNIFEISIGKIKNLHINRKLRKDIASKLTKIHEIGYKNA